MKTSICNKLKTKIISDRIVNQKSIGQKYP